MIKTKIANAWYIKNNKLVNERKYVSTLKYKDLEINFLGNGKNENIIDYAFKDKNNVYWSLSIIHIDIKSFEKVVSKDGSEMDENYCEIIYKNVIEFNIEKYFKDKIKNNIYFNKCELMYIMSFYPELYEDALKSRNKIIERNEKRYEAEEKERQEYKKNKVLEVKQKFEKDYRKVVEGILSGENVNSVKFEFYKDDKYENGITYQNCFLYLAKKYKINIPLATQGFINKKLLRYNFKDEQYWYHKDKRTKGSTKIYKYFSQIYEKVKEDVNI